jgi:Fic family protein
VRREDFAEGVRAQVVRADGGYPAFVPPPLPPTVELTTALVNQLSAADRALGELAGASRTLPNPTLLTRTLTRREAVLSSRIEGTQATLSQLALFEVERPEGAAYDDVREVHNYVDALDHVLDPGRKYPLSLPLLLEAHEILLTGVRGGYATPGEFRRTQNWIGPAGATINTATYVPPPPERMWECLDAFEKYLHGPTELPRLLDLAAIHYQFEAIHPFVDGNGRVGRLLVALLTVEWGLLPAPLLDISAYIEARRDRYYTCLLEVSTRGDWQSWFAFFLRAVEVQSRDVVRRASELHALWLDLRSRVSGARSTGTSAALVDALFDVPAITINRARSLLGVTHRAASLAIDRLVEAGVLREVHGPGRSRLFLAADIVRVAEGAAVED